MFQIGNTFGARTKTNDSSPVDADGTADDLQGARLTLGRAAKAYETKHAELVASRTRLAELDQSIGLKIADDIDANMDILERQTVQARIQQLEPATAVLRQRKDDAEVAVQRAERAAQIDQQCTALENLQVVALEIDAAIDTLSHVTSKLAAALEQARASGAGGKYQSFLVDAKLELQRFVNLAIDPVTGTGMVPSRMRRYVKWSDLIPSPAVRS